MEKLVVERIKNNKNIFTDEELLQIEGNYSILIKVYILGLLDNENLWFICILFWLRFDYEHDRKRSQNRQYGLKYFENKKSITTEISIKTENMLL